MKEKLINFKNWAVSILKSAFTSAVKSFVEKPLKSILTVILSFLGVYTTANIESIMKTYHTYTTDQEMHRKLDVLEQEGKQLRGELKSAYETNFYEQKLFKESFQKFTEQTDKNFKVIHDSLLRQNKRLESFSQGQGTVAIQGGGEVKDSIFSDNWVTIKVKPDGNKLNITYDLNFILKDVSLSYVDLGNGSKTEIYSVNLQSKKDEKAVYKVGDYKRVVTALAEQPKEIQSSTINAGVNYSGYGLEGSLSYSLWTWGDFKFPDMGVSTDFENSVNVFAAVRYNIGSPLPLFTDLWILAGYGYNIIQDKKNVLIGIGTTL